jgi:hypothetical protein
MAPQGGNDFWAVFSQLSERDPVAAAQYLSQAGTPDVFRGRALLGE